MAIEDSQNLIEDGNGEGRGRSSRVTNLTCVAIFFVGCVALGTSVTLSYKLYDDIPSISTTTSTTPKSGNSLDIFNNDRDIDF